MKKYKLIMITILLGCSLFFLSACRKETQSEQSVSTQNNSVTPTEEQLSDDTKETEESGQEKVTSTMDTSINADGNHDDIKGGSGEGSDKDTRNETEQQSGQEHGTTLEQPTEDGDSTMEQTAVGLHGQLRVEGTNLVDQNGETYQLYGMSTHGIAWFPDYVCQEAFETLRDDWNVNCVRIAMYTYENGGYCSNGKKEELKKLVKQGVDAATKLGLYVIIDWHVLNDQNPNTYKEDAKGFFQEMSQCYADQTNIIYEICNEPCGNTSWDEIKNYANEIIPVIREHQKDAVILVGTPNWSQDIDKAAASPLNYDNIMYTLHFYAATHTDWLRDRVKSCVSKGLPIFVSEFGMCDASGNGNNDFEQATKWLELLDKNKISYMCWNLANKDETCCVISSKSKKISDWTEDDLTESGKWICNWFHKK